MVEGGRHPAALNYGDCFAYALSTVRSEPLLYKGEDFATTDTQWAVRQARSDRKSKDGREFGVAQTRTV
jgi:hypothetical protein